MKSTFSVAILLFAIPAVFGRGPYNGDSQVCCDGVVYDLTEEQITKYSESDKEKLCCGEMMYDPYTQLCCNSKITILPKNDSSQYMCCGDAAVFNEDVMGFSETTQMCCKGKSSLYNPNTHFCCGDAIIERTETNKYYIPCGNELINPDEKICCYQEYQLGYSQQSNSGVRPYSLTRRFKSSSEYCCGQTTIDYANMGNQTCCNDTLHPLNILQNSFTCCGSDYINQLIHVCYSVNNREEKRIKLSDPMAYCGNYVYNSDRFYCADQYMLRPFESPREGVVRISYCKGQAYDYDNQLCCGGELYNSTVYGYNTKCCLKKNYNF